jgi:RND family efflux transporter MFP subunit
MLPFNHSRHLSVLLLVAVVASLQACGSPPPSTEMPPAKVSVALPVTGPVQDRDEYPGHVEAVNTVEVRARVSGYLDSFQFTEGAEVKTGDLLFVIDPRPYQAQLDRARAERVQADTRLELARNDLERARTLRSGRVISDEEFDMRNKAVREGEAAVAAARAAEAASQLDRE